MTGGHIGAAPGGARLLLVEDDLPTRTMVAANLAAHAYRVTEAGSVLEALRAWDAQRPDLILLDLGLPDRDGSVVVRRVRNESTTPILILSARSDEKEKVAALEAGADDYVTKPFGLEELRARVAALLRRSAGPAADTEGRLALGAVTLDVGRRRVTVQGEPVELTPREYELLRTLLLSPGRVLTKGRLLRAVWGDAYAAEGHYLHVYVSRLRRKLRAAAPAAGGDQIVVAEPGIGYRVRTPEELSGGE